MLSKIISGSTTLDDLTLSTRRNHRLSCHLICWNVDFEGLLKIQIYLMLSVEAHANILTTSLSQFGDVHVNFILLSFRAPCRASLGYKNHYHRCMTMMAMGSFFIVLDVVVSETYSSNTQTSKRH
jgi:hypothetical protein